jgi:HSP20 family protein
MAGLVPFNRRQNPALSTGLESLYNVLDDFFSDSLLPQRNLSRDTFKIDVAENEKEYRIQAELPGVKKEEISLELNDDGRLIIAVNREEKTEEPGKNYIHRERRLTSMARGIYLADSNAADIKARLDNGILDISVTKKTKSESKIKIDIN